MGQTFGRKALLQETQIFATWSLADVKELAKRFRTQVFGYALVEAQFESIISFKDNMTKQFSLEVLFDTLDNDNDGRIDGLELLAGLTLCCNAQFEEKAKFCFELFDFNLNATLSKKEMVMMMMASICGLNVLTGGTEDQEPDLETFEKLAGNAFLRADKDKSGNISYEEFIAWARSNREMMSAVESLSQFANAAKLDVDSEDSAEVVPSDDELSDFDSAPPSYSPLSLSSLNIVNDSSPLTFADDSDQFSAIIKWKSLVNEPTNYTPSRLWKEGPDTNMTLSWVHGVYGQDGRNYLRYILNESITTNISLSSTSNYDADTIVYPCAQLGVVLNLKDRIQRTYQGHDDQITCLALHPGGRIVATADVASNIHLWDPIKLECLGQIKGIVKQGIQKIQYAPDGVSLVTVGADLDRTIAIYSTSTGEVISSSKGFVSPNNVHDIAYSNSGSELCIVGRKGLIMFFKNIKSRQRAMKGEYGVIGRIGKKQTFHCVAYCGEDCIVGCASGELYKFLNGRCVQIIQAHNSGEAVLCMSYNVFESTLITGGRDGTVRTWTTNLKEVGTELDLAEDLDGDGVADNKSLDPTVISVHNVGNKILVGTKGCDIFEAILPATPSERSSLYQLAWGHAKGELWGLATHPSREEFATAGDDQTLRIWSIRTNEMINLRKLPNPSRTVAYNSSGTLLCVGMQEGSVALLDSSNLRVKSSWRHSAKSITEIKFSFSGLYLAAASADSNIYIYKSNDHLQYFRQAVCRGHVGIVYHLDFSLNGRYIQSCGEDYALYYWDMNGNRIQSAHTIRDLEWATWTCTLGWPVQGIYPPNARITDVNACHAVPEVGVLVTGDDEGLVKLFRYPSLDPGAIRQAHYGHAGHVTCVRFSFNRRNVVSISGSDRTIIVWNHDLELLESSDDEEDNHPSLDGVHSEVQIDYRQEIGDVGDRSVMEEAVHRQQSTQELIELFQKLHPNEIPTPMPWKASVVEPDSWREKNLSTNSYLGFNGATDVDLSLNWVHGYRAYDCRNNLRYNAAGEIVYHTATLAVVYSKSSGKQRFFLGAHSDDIIGLAAHPAGQIFATGEAGNSPAIIIWDGESVRSITRLSDAHERGVSLLAFNSTGHFLASIGLDQENTLVVHEWKKGAMIMKTPTSKGRVLCVSFLAPPEQKDSTFKEIIVTGGESHLKFWTWNGQNVSSQKGIWGPKYRSLKAKRSPDILCVASITPMTCVAGTTDGKLVVFQNYTFQQIVGHPPLQNLDPLVIGSPVQCIWCRKHSSTNANLYFTGNRNGDIAIWEYMEIEINHSKNWSLQLITWISTKDQITFELNGVPAKLKNSSIRSICERDGVLLFGTQGTEIVEVPYNLSSSPENNGLEIMARLVLCGHGSGEVWGLATHQEFPHYFTSGEDGSIRCWSLPKHKLLYRYDFDHEAARALALRKRPTPESQQVFHLAAGCNSGHIIIFGVEIKSKLLVVKEISKRTDCNGIIQVVAYSPNGEYLAAGSHNTNIYLFSLDKNDNMILQTLIGHSGIITHLDFGILQTELVLQSTSQNQELRFWRVKMSLDFPDQKLSAVYVKNAQWSTFTCSMGWPVQGLWPTSPDGTEISAVTRSWSWDQVPVVAAADNYGRVRLFNYPVINSGAPDKCYRGHSKNIRNIAFSAEDEFCVSTGGEDRSIFIWSTDIQEEKSERDALKLQQEANQVSTSTLQESKGTKKLNPIFEDSGWNWSPFIEENSDEEDNFEEEIVINKKKKLLQNPQFWKSVIREPSTWNCTEEVETSCPSASLELHYVYGYRGWDCRNNIGFADSVDEVVYHVAGVGIVLSLSTNTQIHNTEHSDDILCLAVHPEGHTVATGEIGKHPKIVLWDANTGVTLRVILFHQGGVSHLRFTSDGRFLISVGMDSDGTVAMHECLTGIIIGSGKIGRGVRINVLAVGADSNFITGGKNHIKFWELSSNTGGRVEFSSKGGLFGKDVISKCVTAAAYLGTDAITGMANGTLLLWKGRTNIKTDRAHIGPITSMTSLPASNSGANTRSGDSGPRILSAGRDGHIYLWNSQLIRMWDLDMTQSSPLPYSSEIQAIAFREGKLIVGTRTAEIYYIDMLSNESKKIVNGHFGDSAEIRSLASHPHKQYFVTAGDDLTVRVWDSKLKTQVSIANIKSKCRSCVYSPDGYQIALGLTNGKFYVLSEDLLDQLIETTVSKDSLQTVVYAPNGSMVAIGSHDTNIYLLETRNYTIQTVLRGHSGGILSLDWSTDCVVLQSCSESSELFYWNLLTNQRILLPSTIRDCQWSTWTAPFGWSVQGIWSPKYKLNDINSVDRSHDSKLLVIGDDYKKIKLLKYPCVVEEARFKEYQGHSAHVAAVRFHHHSQWVFTAGGFDKAVMQFAVNSSKK